MTDNRAAADHLLELAERGEIDELFRRHGVIVAVLFGSSAELSTETPGDLDIGVLPSAAPVDMLGLLDELAEVCGSDRIDLVDLGRASIVLRSEALVGIPLFEDRQGRFVNEQLRALGERMSTEWMRRLDLELMAR